MLSKTAQQYLQTEEGKAHLGRLGVNTGSSKPMGYGEMLRSFYDANAGNPKLQQSFLSAYLDYANPANQQASRAGDLEFASALMNSGDARMATYGKQLISQYLPPQGPANPAYAATLDKYSKALESTDVLENPDEYNRNLALSQMTPEQYNLYEKPSTFSERLAYANSPEVTGGLSPSDPRYMTILFKQLQALFGDEMVRAKRAGIY